MNKPNSAGTILTTKQLAERWKMAAGTLINWRADGKGPPYIHMGKTGKNRRPNVRYRLVDVEQYEMKNRQAV